MTLPKYFIFTFFLSLFFFIQSVNAAPNKLAIEYPVDITHGKVISNLSITSAITNVEYPYHIYLPAGFDEKSFKKYPIMYASDAQWVFNSFANRIDTKKLPIILVGIEEGPRHSKRRNVDYRLPGVGSFFQFFSTEFMPLVESKYNIDKNNRTLQGASFGGLLTLTFMLADDAFEPLFKNILSYDATVQLQGRAMINIAKERIKLNKEMNVNVVLTGAKKGNGKHVKKFAKQLKKVGFENLTVHTKQYNVSHGAISNASFDDSLDIVLGKTL